MTTLSNLIAALGVLLIVVAIGGLAGIWWALLVLGFFLLASAYALNSQAVVAEPAVPAAVTLLADRAKAA